MYNWATQEVARLTNNFPSWFCQWEGRIRSQGGSYRTWLYGNVEAAVVDSWGEWLAQFP